MISDRGIWLSTEETDTHACDMPLAVKLVQVFKEKGIKDMVDVGCGKGQYLFKFLSAGIKGKGYDGSPLTPELTGKVCEVKDFSDPVDIGKFDLVLSLEVGEHIPVQYEHFFINNLCRASKKYICVSWAIEGQGGTGHINCRNNDYVVDQFSKRGWVLDKDTSDILRKVSTFSWFKNTIMVFTHE